MAPQMERLQGEVAKLQNELLEATAELERRRGQVRRTGGELVEQQAADKNKEGERERERDRDTLLLLLQALSLFYTILYPWSASTIHLPDLPLLLDILPLTLCSHSPVRITRS